MSFNPQMHGAQPFSYSQPLFQDISDAAAIKINTLQAKLNQKLGPEYISQRPGPGGGKLTYAEGWKIINLANEVFGFNGWSSNVVNLTTDYIDFSEESKKFNVGVTAIVRVTLRDGVFHEDIGYGILENSKSKGAALDKCKKEAVTDALKRSLRNFGNLLGNCLYDKSYTQEIIKIKVPPPKFDKSQLHRRPEFDESKQQPGPSMSTAAPTIKPEPSAKPLSSLPPHMRPGATPNAKPNSSHNTPPPPYNQNPPQTNNPAQIQTPTRAQPQLQHCQQPSPRNMKKYSPQRISFASPTRDPDESFSYSDDDAFLAQVDMGEGDIGRPIDYEEAGDVSAGASTIVTSDLSSGSGQAKESVGAEERGSMGPPANVGDRNGISNTNAHARQAQVQHRPGANSILASDPSTSRVRNQNLNVTMPHQNPPTSNHSTSHIHNNVTTSSPTVQQQHRIVQSNPPSECSSEQNKGVSGSRPIQNQNQAPHPNTIIKSNSNTTSTATKRPITPSMGGFHFPPGMNPLEAPQQQLPSAQRGPTQSTSTPAFSLKRSADTMNASMVSRRPVQGMGLAQQQQGFSVKREPFTRLQVGEGGDVKRMKF